jgi:membrane protease subunit HflK
MNLNPVLQALTAWPTRFKHFAFGMFNLNDPRWGRDDGNSDGTTPPANDTSSAGDEKPVVRPPNRPQGKGPNQGRPDLDNARLQPQASGLFAARKNPGRWV